MVVTNDAVTAHLGALGGEPGAVIVAGTGAIALAAAPEGWARADGWGTMLGDDGGGYWIGRRALALALRAPTAAAAPPGCCARPPRRASARSRRSRGPSTTRPTPSRPSPRSRRDVADLARGGDEAAAAIFAAAGASWLAR